MRERPRRFGVALCLVGLALSAVACESGPTTLRGQLQAWANNATYSADVSQINEDLTALQNGLREHKLLALRTECEGFSVDVETLYGELPTPDQTITYELGYALPGYYSAARDCFDSPSFTSTQFRSYEELMKKWGVTYKKALSQLRAYGVQ